MAPRRLSDSSDSLDDAEDLLGLVNENQRKNVTTTRRAGLRSQVRSQPQQRAERREPEQPRAHHRSISPPVAVPDSLKDVLSLQMELERSEILGSKQIISSSSPHGSTTTTPPSSVLDRGITGFLNIDNDDDDLDPQHEEEYQLIQSAQGLLQEEEENDNDNNIQSQQTPSREIRIDASRSTSYIPPPPPPPPPVIPPDYTGRLPVQLNDANTLEYLLQSGMLNDVFSMHKHTPIDPVIRSMFEYLFFQLTTTTAAGSMQHPNYLDCLVSWMRDLDVPPGEDPLITPDMVQAVARRLGMIDGFKRIPPCGEGATTSNDKQRFDSSRISNVLEVMGGYARVSPRVDVRTLTAMAQMSGGLGIDIEVGKVLNIPLFKCLDAIMGRIVTVDDTKTVLDGLLSLTHEPVLQVKLVRLMPSYSSMRSSLALSFYLGRRTIHHDIDDAHQLGAVLVQQVIKDSRHAAKSIDPNDMNWLRCRLLLVDYSIHNVQRTTTSTTFPQPDGPFTLLISCLDKLVHSLGDPHNHSPTKSAIKQVVAACVDRIRQPLQGHL